MDIVCTFLSIGVKITTILCLVPRLRMEDLYFHAPLCCYGMQQDSFTYALILLIFH
jgi:hypothetical protein